MYGGGALYAQLVVVSPLAIRIYSYAVGGVRPLLPKTTVFRSWPRQIFFTYKSLRKPSNALQSDLKSDTMDVDEEVRFGIAVPSRTFVGEVSSRYD